MDQSQCTALVEVIEHVKELSDPRCRRGVRYPWWVLVTIVVAALLAGCNQTRAMAQWAAAQQRGLARFLPLPHGRPPSESTLQRALRELDPVWLAALITRIQGHDQPAAVLDPVAVDGKTLRAADRPGAPLHVLELARHDDGALLRLTAVPSTANEYSTSPVLLAGYDLTNRVVTGDAAFCQRRLSDYIVQRGGAWLWAVKANQPDLHDALAQHFAAPRGGPHPLTYQSHLTASYGHGRWERRCLEVSPDLPPDLGWTGAAQVMRRTTYRTEAGRDAVQVSYWLTSLTPAQADAALLEQYCRGHWTIENQVHWVRDVTFGEDACTTRTGHAPLALALLRGLVAWLIRHVAAWPNLPDARRHYCFHPDAALALLGARRL